MQNIKNDALLGKNMGKNIEENISKNLSGKYSQRPLDHAKNSATDAFKTNWKRVIQKTSEATGDFNANKIADRITNVSKNLWQNNSEAVINVDDKEIPNELYISQEKVRKLLTISD